MASASFAATRGSIYIGPMASGEAVRILSLGYTLQPLTNACPDCRGIVVGPADLNHAWIVNRLKAAYEAGHAVGVTNAPTANIRRLHDLLGHRGSAEPVPVSKQVELAAFRKAQRSDGGFEFRSHLLLPRLPAADMGPLLTKEDKKQLKRVSIRWTRRKLRRELLKERQKQREHEMQQRQARADRNDIQALSRIFSATPELPEQPPPGGGPQQNLINLAESYESRAIQSDSYGDQVQVVNTVWAARSFLNSADLYYVLQETDYHIVPEVSDGILHYFLASWNNNVSSSPSNLRPLGPGVTLLQPSPQTTMEATTDISSVSFTIAGSAGWNETEGLNASVSGSVRVSNSKETTIPPINISNNANLATGETAWSYDVNELPKQAETIDLFSQWIWSIPFLNYSTRLTQFKLSSQANLAAVWRLKPPLNDFKKSTSFDAALTSQIPLPFGRTFSLQPPAVTGLSPSSVQIGTPFTIQGTGFYPSLVKSVLIGGTPVNQDNITTTSDTEIKVIAPNTGTDCVSGCNVAVRTTQGTSNTNFTITIH